MKFKVLNKSVHSKPYLLLIALLFSLTSFGQPSNDQCANASVVNISGSGFGIGTFSSTIDDITFATLQTGETFAPAILGAGQSQKSMWYKFILPTTRSVKVTLAQTGTAIAAGDVGFTVYKANACLPGNADISFELTPIGVFGNSLHPCVDSAVYYVQVSAKSNASGLVYIIVETNFTTAPYDRPAQAYNFGSLTTGVRAINYLVDCQSIEDANETCTALANYQQYNKSTWHVFTTAAYFDYLVLFLSQQSYVSGHKFGFKVYQGDVTATPYTSLPVVASCDSLETSMYYAAKKIFGCGELNTNTTYSIQIFFHYAFNDNVVVALNTVGTHVTNGPEPTLAGIPAPTNALGILPYDATGLNTAFSDYHACNSRHSLHNCPLDMPLNGINSGLNSNPYNLSSFFSFTLATTSEVTIFAGSQNCAPQYLYMRLFKQGVTNNCNDLDPVNIKAAYYYGWQHTISCLDPGNYVLQVLGTDTVMNNNFSYGSFYNSPIPLCVLSNLGQKFTGSITVKYQPNSAHYSLQSPGAFDSINVVGAAMQPLVNDVLYSSHPDTFGCAKTVLPWDTACAPGNNKAIYREFLVNDSTTLYVGGIGNFNWKLYQGDANALANAQNVHNYPDHIQGLNSYTKCLFSTDCGATKVCLQPGVYTQVTFGSDASISATSGPAFMTSALTTAHGTPASAENLGDILAQGPTGTNIYSSVDYFSCKDNAVVIAGFQPCTLPIYGLQATKAIYRQFYLSQTASINIDNHYQNGCDIYNNNTGVFTVFAGKASDGLSTLTQLPSLWQCTKNIYTLNSCNVLPAGWYTIVTYGIGPSYTNPASNTGPFASGQIGMPDRIHIYTNPMCPGPKYNRPNLAAIDTTTLQPFLVQWGPKAGHTSAYPKTDTTYVLPMESFNCTVDTPFTMHPVTSCNTNMNRVAYWVFTTTQESFVQIDTKNLWGAVYSGNARNGTANFDASTIIQSCIKSYGFIQLCKLQPGTYTLVIFAGDAQNCTSIQPTIYIDQPGGYSRFDFAKNAYDFGVIPPDSIYHSGKVGDINPLDPGRAPSNDFFYCTTGAGITDPMDPVCATAVNPNVYNGTLTQFFNVSPEFSGPPTRRNLWYTFVVKEGGTVRVQALIKTLNKGYYPRFAVYKSDVNGTLPFSTVLANGLVDSTIAQGLTFITRNTGSYPQYCFGSSPEVSFNRNSCDPVEERYYVLVENPSMQPFDYSGLQPNSQVEVYIQLDSVNAIQPLFDHYYQANNIGTNLGPGTYTGATDNYSCATGDATDPVNYYTWCNKTLWYKFSTTVSGVVRYSAITPGYDQVQLFRQTIPGDSTTAGMAFQGSNGIYNPATNSYWYEACVAPGTYYLILNGCGKTSEYVYTQIQIIEEKGDFCSTPVIAGLNGPGANISSVKIDCHTIGTDYGEFNPTLTCPNGAPKNSYKTSWFRLDISGTDTLDVTTWITENTTANSSQIKYRLMDGNCGAMQERSCVQDALTQDTYKCLPPGSYYLQVFSPVGATGTIDLHVSAVVHADTCAQINNCLSTAVFIPQVDCTVNDYVSFTNLSTYGSGVQYQWDFGYNGQTSNAVSPTFVYPHLATSQSYNVKLKVLNNGCGGQDSTTVAVTVPGRPYVNLGNDTTLCNPGATLLLNATSWPGATYDWTGASGPTHTLYYPSVTGYPQTVKVTYNGCIARDTIFVAITPFVPLIQNSVICGNDSVWLNANHNGGTYVSYLWNTGSTGTAIYASQPGLYTNTLTWRNCTYKDSFTVIKAATPFVNTDTTLCYPFQSFILNGNVPLSNNHVWQNGANGTTFNVTTPGTYWVQYYVGSCLKRDTVVVNATSAPLTNISTASSCVGQGYTLPWGTVVTASGTYSDTTRYALGCDSLIRKVNLSVIAPVVNNAAASICAAQSYTLPWGPSVNTPGIYRDTVKTLSGCDSLIRSVNLTMSTVSNTSNNATVCQGQTYMLPWGASANAAGTYKDTLHYVNGGCDSVIRTVNLSVLPSITNSSSITICAGQSYTLPWGAVASTTGVYKDTIHYFVTGCDSLIQTVNLIVNAPSTQNTSASICANQTYLLPWGQTVNSPGIYKDTLHYLSGCDSVIKVVTIAVNPVNTNTSNVTICGGQSYILPSGLSVSSAGIYKDTLHYMAGCDSLVRTTNLTVNNTTVQSQLVSICSGQTYVLPWGAVVNTTGVYKDTLHFAVSGCDSVQRSVSLTVLAPQSNTTNATICTGATYLLPWGQNVNTAGIYKDTLHYLAGCDSLIKTVNLSVNTGSTQTTSAGICGGQSYLLPWGQSATTSGIYKDTLHYLASGCDSLVRVVNLTVYNTSSNTSNATICAGASYTLPWGPVVNTTGVYKDTLHYFNGCDSLVRTVNLTVNAPTTLATNPVICAGANYTLPWGAVVNTNGTYKDTLHYQSGCDSLLRVVNLQVKPVSVNSISATTCANQSYTLPWGQVVSSTGIYRDTLDYAAGCDSLIRIVNLTVKPSTTNNINAAICSGNSYLLPWGSTVSVSGIYKDTLHYANGCDSIIRVVNLVVNSTAVITSKDTAICAGQNYMLPWGGSVNTAGIYVDTTKSLSGCDSLIRTVRLTVNPRPVVSLTKSNDINCTLGTAQMKATGGKVYLWSPPGTLSNANINMPVASPISSTTYIVRVTSGEGCSTVDSIRVNVVPLPVNGFDLPNAFTPNGDGLNDCFGVKSWGAVTDLKLSIYDRWGALIFQTTDPSRCWDGNYKGKELTTAVFVFQVSANTICGKIYRKGTVTLIR